MRKRKRLTAFFLFSFCLCGVFAQEDGYGMALGPGLEWNMSSGRKSAGGAAVSADYRLFNAFAAGLSFGMSSNFTALTAIELAASFRWYVFGSNRRGIFAQADGGLFVYMEDVQPRPMFLGGLRAGYRLPVGGRFYVEPYVRGGYPFVLGVGMSAGMLLLPGGGLVITATGDRPSRQPERVERVTGRGTIFNEEEAPEAPAEGGPVAGEYYFVRQGDTLWHLAIWVYGDALKWTLIAAANGDIPNPDLIYVGQRLYIPFDTTEKKE